MPITQFDHYTLRSADVDATAAFYEQVLGFRVQAIDGFAFPMRLLFLGDQAVVHLLGAGPALDTFLGRSAPSHATPAERRTGNMEHVAFNGIGQVDFRRRLDAAGISSVQRTLADYGVAQLLFEDPDGVEIEVNCPIDEADA